MTLAENVVEVLKAFVVDLFTAAFKNSINLVPDILPENDTEVTLYIFNPDAVSLKMFGCILAVLVSEVTRDKRISACRVPTRLVLY